MALPAAGQDPSSNPSTLRLARMEVDPEDEAASEAPVEVSPTGRFLRYEARVGRGAYKDVFKAYDTEEGTEVAWNVTFMANFTAEERARMYQEIALLKQLRHENIISFVDSWLVAGDTGAEPATCVFITELMSGGTLRDFMKRLQQELRFSVVKRWCRQILAAMAFLHEREPPILHRDLKLDNFFYDASSGTVRLGDFGLSTSLSSMANVSSVGTPVYMAPEMWGDVPYDEKVDIYAFGLSVLEMISGQEPFFGLSFCQIYTKVVGQHEEPRSVQRIANNAARAFVRRCIVAEDPAARPSARELLLDPFLQEGTDDDDEALCTMTPLAQGCDSDYHREAMAVSARSTHADGTKSVPPPGPPRLGPPEHQRHQSETADAHAQRARIGRHWALMERMKTTSSQYPTRLLNHTGGARPSGVLLPLRSGPRLGPRVVEKIPASLDAASEPLPAPVPLRLGLPAGDGAATAGGTVEESRDASNGNEGKAPVMRIRQTSSGMVGKHSAGFTVRTTTSNFEGSGAPADIQAMLTCDTTVVDVGRTAMSNTVPHSAAHLRRNCSLGRVGFVRAPSMTELRVLHHVTVEEFLKETRRVQGSTHTLAIRLETDEGEHFELEFPFHTERDTPESIAQELVDALQIAEEAVGPIVTAIRAAMTQRIHQSEHSPMTATQNEDGGLDDVPDDAPAVAVPLHVVLDKIVDSR